MNEKYLEICEEQGWFTRIGDDGTIELEQWSPAGEDFIFTVSAENFCRQVFEYYYDFDIDEHIELWAHSAGRNGVPSFRRLCEDAEDIADMLERLAGALLAAEVV